MWLSLNNYEWQVLLLIKQKCHTTCATFVSLLKAGHVPYFLNNIQRNEAIPEKESNQLIIMAFSEGLTSQDLY